MTDDEKTRLWNTRIEEALREVAAERVPGGVLTSWVVVFEVMEPDGAKSIQRAWPDELTIWARDGLLRGATSEGWAAMEYDDDDDEEDEDP